MIPLIARRAFLTSLTGGLLAAPLAAEAQLAGKVYRIGFLRNGPPPKTFIEGFRQGLRDLGYVEGQNITLEYGLAGSADQLPAAAAELVRRKVDAIVASGTPPVPVAGAPRGRSPSFLWPRSTQWRRGWSLVSLGQEAT